MTHEHRGSSGSALPIVLWPGIRLPQQQVLASKTVAIGDALVVTHESWIVDPPTDLYIWEVLRLDARDPHAAAEFCTAFGNMFYTRDRQPEIFHDASSHYGGIETGQALVRWRDEIEWVLTDDDDLTEDEAALMAAQEQSIYDAAIATWTARNDPQVCEAATAIDPRLKPSLDSRIFHVSDFALMIDEYRDMVSIWLNMRQGTELPLVSKHLDLSEPVKWFAQTLTGDLVHYSPVVSTVADYRAATEDDASIAELHTLVQDFRAAGSVMRAGVPATYPRVSPVFPLTSVLAAQLFNAMVDQPVYQTCQRADCRELFVHQRGRSEYGMHKAVGLKYCSKTCCDVVTQRNRRQRARAKSEKTRAGGAPRNES